MSIKSQPYISKPMFLDLQLPLIFTRCASVANNFLYRLIRKKWAMQAGPSDAARIRHFNYSFGYGGVRRNLKNLLYDWLINNPYYSVDGYISNDVNIHMKFM